MAIFNQFRIVLSIFVVALLLTLSGCSYSKFNFARVSFQLSKCPSSEFVLPTSAKSDDAHIVLKEFGVDEKYHIGVPIYEVITKSFIFTTPGPRFGAYIDHGTCTISLIAIVPVDPYQEDQKILKSETIKKASKEVETFMGYASLLMEGTNFRVEPDAAIFYIGDWEKAKELAKSIK